MNKYFYLKKGIPRAVVFSQAITTNTGTTEEDYNQSKFVEITEQQSDFYLSNPTASFSEIINMEMTTQPPAPIELPIEIRYKRLVVKLIKERYDDDDEKAIIRQKDSNPDKFAEYYAYCEQCKVNAKQELGIND